MEPFVIKSGDLGRSVAMWVVPDTDVTGATAVFSMRRADTLQVVINQAAAQIVQANPAKLLYQWATGQTDQDAFYEFQFRIFLSNGKQVTAPSSGYYPLIIKPSF